MLPWWVISLASRKLLKLLTRRVWEHVVQRGDIVVDATCGNGHDTLALYKMVKDDLGRGCVYGMDIQEDAIESTSSLLDLSLDPTERKSVKLYASCHSRMLEVLPELSSIRLVAFNLGYLPRGNKEIITQPHSTLLALEAARKIIVPGGLISVVVYVGHPGGREEYDTVLSFSSNLSAEVWSCSQIQMLNRPTAPILFFLFRKIPRPIDRLTYLDFIEHANGAGDQSLEGRPPSSFTS